jgi:hypothetical protein
MLTVDRTVRALGFPGFQTQMLVWLAGRLAAEQLQEAIQRLSTRCPLMTSRLIEARNGTNPYWQFRSDAASGLQEVRLASGDSQEVLDYAARQLSMAHDPATHDPIQFHLLHRPHGQDVLLLQYPHMLLDNNAAILLLREIERSFLAASTNSSSPTRFFSNQDLIQQYLQRFPRTRRRTAANRVTNMWRSWQGGSVMLGQPISQRKGAASFQIAGRCLSAEQTEALRKRVVQICGLPSISMALLGSAFRAIQRLAPTAQRGNFSAGIGVDLGLRNNSGPIFQNFVSLLFMFADAADLHDREALLRRLSQQLRQQIEDDIDLGVLQWTALYRRRPRHCGWIVEPLLRRCFSLWYAFFGTLDRAVGSSFCGTDVDDVFFTGPCWAPMGLTLIVNQYRGRLLFQATYIPEAVPETLANAFLDEVLREVGSL